jgi:hypothetical protein
MSKKKPTAMELKNAVTNVILQVTQVMESFRRLDYLIGKYIEFKGDEDKFKEFLKEGLEESKPEEKESK